MFLPTRSCDRFPRPFTIALPSAALFAAMLAVPPPSSGADSPAPARKVVQEILVENPSAVQRLIGAYSEIPGYPKGGKSVKLYLFDGSDLVCIAPIKATMKDPLDCWRLAEAPAPVRKIVAEKEAEDAKR